MDIHNLSNPQSWAKCNLFSFYLLLKFFYITNHDTFLLWIYILQNWFQHPNHKRNPFQVWILFLLEAPPNTQAFYNLNHVINWTATFRHDSDLVAPYEKYFKLPESSSIEEEGENNHFKSRPSVSFQSFLECMTKKYNRWRKKCFLFTQDFHLHSFPIFYILSQSSSLPNQMEENDELSFIPESTTNNETIDDQRNKVAWFVSNCGAKNSRLEYARELAKYIQVDIFGS